MAKHYGGDYGEGYRKITGVKIENLLYLHSEKGLKNLGSIPGARGKAPKLKQEYNDLRAKFANMAKSNFINLYLKNVKINGESAANYLNTISKSADLMTKTEFVNFLDEAMKKELNEKLDKNYIESLIATKEKLTSQVQDAFKEGNDFNKILTAMSELIEIVDGSNNPLAVLLAGIGRERPLGMTETGQKLNEALDKWEARNNGRNISTILHDGQIQTLLQRLRTIATDLQTGHFKFSKKTLNARDFTRVINNLLGVNEIAEQTSLMVKGETFRLATAAGKNSGGKYVATESGLSEKDGTRRRKVDKFRNFTVSKIYNKQSINIEFNLGASVKFYESGDVFSKSEDGKSNIVVKTGSGGMLKYIIPQIWENESDQYYIYNYILHDRYRKELNNIFLLKQLLRLFTTAGTSQDFAQIMLVNGNLVSMWDIVQYITNTKNLFDLSTSQGGAEKQGVSLTITGRQKMKWENKWIGSDSRNYDDALERLGKVHGVFKDSFIEASLHYQKIINIIGNNKKMA